MKNGENEFIRELITSDLKKIPNPGFTQDTVNRIRNLQAARKSRFQNYSLFILYPVVLYAMIYILTVLYNTLALHFSIRSELFAGIINWSSNLLLNPTTISVGIAFTLLFVMDGYLTRKRQKV
ncbi:MAG: hypothetical protein ACNS62_17975 [Candidatus Cyclobacteriaceae bacterium M3_2C_046]